MTTTAADRVAPPPPPPPGGSKRLVRSESAVAEVTSARPAAGSDGWTQHIAPGIYQVVPPWSYHSGRPIDQKSTVAGQGIFNIDGGLAKRSAGAFSPLRGAEMTMRAQSTKQEHWKAAALTTRSGAPLQLTFKRSAGQCAPDESMMTAATTIGTMMPEATVLLGRDRIPGQGVGRGEVLARLHSHGLKHDLDHPLAPRKGVGLCSPLRTRQEVSRVEFKAECSGMNGERTQSAAMTTTSPTQAPVAGEESANLVPARSTQAVHFSSSDPHTAPDSDSGPPIKTKADAKVVPSKVIKAEQVSSAADLHRAQQVQNAAVTAAHPAMQPRAKSPTAPPSDREAEALDSRRSRSPEVRLAPLPSPAAERAISASAVIGRWQGSTSCQDLHERIGGDATFAAGAKAPRALEMHRADLSKDVDGMMRRGLGSCRHNGNVSLQLAPPGRKADSTIIDAVAAEVREAVSATSLARRATSPGYSPPRREQTADARVLAWDALPASPAVSPTRRIMTRHILGSRSPTRRDVERSESPYVYCGSPLQSAAERGISPPIKEVPIFDRKCAGVFSPIRPADEKPWTAAPMPHERQPSRVAHPNATRAPSRSSWREEQFVHARFLAKEQTDAQLQEHSPARPAGIRSERSPSPPLFTTAAPLTRPIRSASAAAPVSSRGGIPNVGLDSNTNPGMRVSSSLTNRRRISYASEYEEEEAVHVVSAKLVPGLEGDAATLPAAPSQSSKSARAQPSAASTAAPPSVSSPLQTVTSQNSRRRSPSPPIGPVVMSDGLGLGGGPHTNSRASTAATTGQLSRGGSSGAIGVAAATGMGAGAAGAGPPISSSAKMAVTLSGKSNGSMKSPTSSRIASVNGHAPHSLFGGQAARTAPRQNQPGRTSSRGLAQRG